MFLLVAALTVFVSACSPGRANELERSRALWESQAVRHYRFELTISCFCVFIDQMPLTIEVQDGQVVAMSAANGADISDFRDFYGKFATVENLFGTIEDAAGSNVLNVQYDPTNGHPVSIYVDPEELVADDEMGYDVANLQVLP
jgi:hypothetical protein